MIYRVLVSWLEFMNFQISDFFIFNEYENIVFNIDGWFQHLHLL